MRSFTEYFEQFQDEFTRLFLEMPRYKKGKGGIPFDDYDVNYLRAFLDKVNEEAKKNKLKVTDEQIIDVFAQALRQRYGKNILKGKDDDYQNLKFNLVRKEKAEGKKTQRIPLLSGVIVQQVPVFPEQLKQKIRARGFDPNELQMAETASMTQGEHLLGYMRNKEHYVWKWGGSPTYSPPEQFRLADKDDTALEPEDKPTRRFQGEEMTVKSLGKIHLDENDEMYLDDVRAALEEYHKKFPSRIGKNIEQYLAQALAVRYSNCFVTKDNNKFVPRSNYKYPTGHIILKLHGGQAVMLPFVAQYIKSEKKIRINADKLAMKFEKVRKTVGYDFVDHPLINCGAQGPERIDGASVNTARRWMEQGFFQPFQATTGSEFLPDDEKLADVERRQEAYMNNEGPTPNESEKATPKISWRDLVRKDILVGWKLAMPYVQAKNIAQQKGYTEFLMNERDEIIETVFTQLLYGLSGKDEYTNQKWRRARAATLIKSYIDRRIDSRWKEISTDAPAGGGEGESTATLGSMTPAAPTAPEQHAERPSLGADSSDKEIAAWVDSFFSKEEQGIDRRYNAVKRAWEVDPFDTDEWYTRDELLARMKEYYRRIRGG